MSMFTPQSGMQKPVELIPAGTLAWAVIKVREIKKSKSEPHGEYFDLDLTIDGGQFDRRHIFEMLSNPLDQNVSENGRQMATSSLTRILEAAGVFNPADPASYNKPFASGNDLAMVLDGQRVGIKVKIEKGKDGYQDKNRVGEWLTPHPSSHTAKLWQQLLSGQQRQLGGFAAPQAAQPAFTPPPQFAQPQQQQWQQPQQSAMSAPPAWMQNQQPQQRA